MELLTSVDWLHLVLSVSWKLSKYLHRFHPFTFQGEMSNYMTLLDYYWCINIKVVSWIPHSWVMCLLFRVEIKCSIKLKYSGDLQFVLWCSAWVKVFSYILSLNTCMDECSVVPQDGTISSFISEFFIIWSLSAACGWQDYKIQSSFILCSTTCYCIRTKYNSAHKKVGRNTKQWYAHLFNVRRVISWSNW